MLTELIQQYKKLVESGANIQTIQQFYDDDVEHIENNEAPIHGKQNLLTREEKILGSVHSFQQKITLLVMDESNGVVMGEMDIFFDSKKHGPQRLQEAFIQYWRNGKITYIRFYYSPTQPVN
jgi:ketosteroid isomerase-like protein